MIRKPEPFPYSWEQLWPMSCAQIRALGLRHWPTVIGKKNPVYYIKVGCTCG